MPIKPARLATPILTLSLLAGCGGDGLSTVDVQTAAKERVRQQLGLSPEATLFTRTFVGKPVDGDLVLCGTVSGKRADGTPIVARRFIAATDPAQWVKFERVTKSSFNSQPQMFVEWAGTCEPMADGIADGPSQ